MSNSAAKKLTLILGNPHKKLRQNNSSKLSKEMDSIEEFLIIEDQISVSTDRDLELPQMLKSVHKMPIAKPGLCCFFFYIIS